MKMQTQSVDLNAARKVFGWTSVQKITQAQVMYLNQKTIKYDLPSPDYIISRVGRQQPNIVILMKGSELPVQDGDIIDPFRGFWMPKVVDLLPLSYCNMRYHGISFCQHLQAAKESLPITFLQLVDPEKADCILVTGLLQGDFELRDVATLEEPCTLRPKLGKSVYGKDYFLWNEFNAITRPHSSLGMLYLNISRGNSQNRVTEGHIKHIYYRLLPLSSYHSAKINERYMKRREIIRYANIYLNITGR